MDETQQTEKMIFNDYQDSSFSIFLEFFPNLNYFKEIHQNDESKEIQRKYDWLGSLRTKINAVSVLSEEVQSQYNKAVRAKEEMEQKGYGSGLESTLLLIKFETMLNSIYSLCDNLAFVSYKLHPGIKKLFHDQRKNIAKSRGKYPQYSEYLNLIESADWYEKLHTMRSESTHYLAGFVFHSQNGLGILYQNMEHSDDRIEIENISNYVVDLLRNINEFLERYGQYHLKQFIAEGHTTFHPCLFPNPFGKGFSVGGRIITYSEYMRKHPGKCQFNAIPCPRKNICPAYLKNDESTIS